MKSGWWDAHPFQLLLRVRLYWKRKLYLGGLLVVCRVRLDLQRERLLLNLPIVGQMNLLSLA